MEQRLLRLERKVNLLEVALRRVLRIINQPAAVMYFKHQLELSNEDKDTQSTDKRHP